MVKRLKKEEGAAKTHTLYTLYYYIMELYQMTDNLLAVAGQIIYDGNLYHGVSTGLLLECSTSGINQNLSCEGGVVDLHIEFEELVMRLTAYALANQVYSVANIV